MEAISVGRIYRVTSGEHAGKIVQVYEVTEGWEDALVEVLSQEMKGFPLRIAVKDLSPESTTKSVDEIKQAVEQGKKVFWKNRFYVTEKDNLGQFLIHCLLNDNYWGLTWRDEKTLNGKLSEFFIV